MRWAIVGTGNIARQIAVALRDVTGAELLGVASRSAANAERFGEAFDIPRRYSSYEALAADAAVDIVYVATPNAFHFAHAAMFLRAKKAVLLEKPFTVHAREAEALVSIAKSERAFLMEAMWTRFVPAVRQLSAWIAEGAIGEVRLVESSFGFRASEDELAALLSSELAVGSLLDVGVYSVSLAHAAFGRAPIEVAAMAELAANGVDRQAIFLLRFEGGGLAHGASAVTHETPHDAWITGTRGRIHLHAPFWSATRATLFRVGMEELELHLPHKGNGYEYQLAAVDTAVREGLLEHSWMPLEESVAVMKTMDQLRAQAGVRFPADDRADAHAGENYSTAASSSGQKV